jgi:hypothetical protein
MPAASVQLFDVASSRLSLTRCGGSSSAAPTSENQLSPTLNSTQRTPKLFRTGFNLWFHPYVQRGKVLLRRAGSHVA